MFSMVNALKRLEKSFPFNHAFIADNAEPENWSTHVDRVSDYLQVCFIIILKVEIFLEF